MPDNRCTLGTNIVQYIMVVHAVQRIMYNVVQHYIVQYIRRIFLHMNFRVFIRSLFIITLIAAISFIIYANVLRSDGSVRDVPDATQTVGEKTTTSASADNGMGGTKDASSSGATDTTDDDGSEAIEPVSTYVRENTVIKLSFLGDVALGQDHRFNHYDSFDHMFEKKEGDYAYFFSGVLDLLEQDDLTIANLETTLSNETKQAEKYDIGNNYWFNGKPEYAHILKAGSVEIANLANNHSYDYGQKGYDATRQALTDAGIEYFGYTEALYKEIKGIRIGMAGFNQLGEYEQGLDMDVFKAEVEALIKKLRGECDLVIANFHWGKEYKYKYEELQKELAYIAIDSGADLVIGHHPHVLQFIEQYNGKYIAYSLGNFCFGGRKTPDDYDTAIFQQTFVFDSDDVLQPIEEPDIIPCSLSSAKGINNYKPMVATGDQRKRVYEKLDFSPTLTEEEKAAIAAKTDMVRLDAAVKDIEIELRYATSDNVIGEPVYESNDAYLRKGTADKLNKANKILMEKGYSIKVWDAYRAQRYQQFLYDNAPDKSVFLDPKKGSSNHTRGAAVDCTLVTLDGIEVDMPTDFDDGSLRAYRTYDECTEEQKKNALILENAMKSVGFIPLKNEWWHFDDTDYKSYKPVASYPAGC